MTALLAGKRILSLPKEIQEVRNAFAAYEAMGKFSPTSRADLLAAHKLLTTGLVDYAGSFRTSAVGIMKGRDVAHVALPAKLVPALMDDLFNWFKNTDEHPLVASCIFHYELEFIHPFEDGRAALARQMRQAMPPDL